MSVSVEYARGMISQLYPAVSWKARVNRMKPPQVLAIYYQAKEAGKFDKKKKTAEVRRDDGCYQMTIFEYLERTTGLNEWNGKD